MWMSNSHQYVHSPSLPTAVEGRGQVLAIFIERFEVRASWPLGLTTHTFFGSTPTLTPRLHVLRRLLVHHCHSFVLVWL